MKTYTLFLLFAMLPCYSLSGQEWLRFRGNEGNGKSAETNLIKEWPDGGPKLLWTAQGLGAGFSSVSINDEMLYTIGDIDSEQFVFAVSTTDGKNIWKQKIGKANSGSYPGSRSTPTIDNGHVYCLSTDGTLFCLVAKTGKPVWEKNLVEEYDAKVMLAKGEWEWKFSESPLVDDGQVVITPGSKDALMVAFDAKTGAEKWRTKSPDFGDNGEDGTAYSSIVVGQACGTKQYVQLVGRGLVSVDAKNGDVLWKYNNVANKVANISNPLVLDDYVFASTGYQTGSVLLKLTKSKDDAFAVEEKYFLGPNTFQNHHGGFVFKDGFIYGGQGHNKGFPICLRLEDGKVMWGPIRNQGKGSAAVCYADGHLNYRYQDGSMILVEASPDGYKEKGFFNIPGVSKPSWSHPVICGGKLYLKEQDRLFCYDVKL